METKTYPVYAVPTTAITCEEWRRIDCDPVASKTAAIQAVRRAGYRVMRIGGLVELCTSQEDLGDVWTVTVYAR